MTFTRDVVAAEVRAAIARANITQAALAAQIRLSPAGLSERLSGARPFNTDDLAEIADVLGVDPFSFLMGVPSRSAGSAA